MSPRPRVVLVAGPRTPVLPPTATLPTSVLRVDPTVPHRLHDDVRALGHPVTACYVAEDGLHAFVRPLEEATGRPVLTAGAARAVALTAAALLYLGRTGQDPLTARMLVAGAGTCPALPPLLLACGMTDVTLWNAHDARRLPLASVARHSHVLLDLLGDETVAAVRPDRPEGSVLSAAGLGTVGIVTGLLTAFAGIEATPEDLDEQLYRECVRAVVTRAPGDIPPAAALLHPRVTSAVQRVAHDHLVLRRLSRP